jgi:hypothetical protein
MRDAHRSGSRPGPDPHVVRKAVLRRSLTERLIASCALRSGRAAERRGRRRAITGIQAFSQAQPSMLELRPTCEHCNKALPPDSLEARICTYECTFWTTEGVYAGSQGRL